MTAVTFTFGGYLHDADDLSDFVPFVRRSPSTTRSPEGDVYLNAAGERKWTSSPGVRESFSVSTRTRDPDVHTWLNERDGAMILYRDKRQRLEYGITTSVQVTDLDAGLFDLQLEIKPVDHTPDPVEGGG